MGINNSHHQQTNYSTPERQDSYARIGLDPRSPTANISRTPIIVLKTPEATLDPRSPTYGIIRTPIILDEVKEQEGDLQSTAPEIVQTPVLHLLPVTSKAEAKEKVEDSSLAPQLDTEVKSTACSSVEMDTYEPLIHENSSDALNEINLQNMSPVESNEGLKEGLSNPALPTFNENSSSSKESSTPRKKSRATEQKELFPMQRVSISCNKKSIRSPLSIRTLDMNSPRKIVQWNQSKKVENERGCQLESLNSRFIANDKENFLG